VSEKSNNSQKMAVMSFVLPFFIGGTYYVFVAIEHIQKQPHQLIDFVIAVPFAYITLGTCSGIVCFCFWQFADGFLKAVNSFLIPKEKGANPSLLVGYQTQKGTETL